MFVYPKRYDIAVIGAGHAGIEAALAGARMGCETVFLTINADSIGQMSCNPAIGGLAKGHLVREIDALGGEMAKATDLTGLQFRMLNTKKGPAVWAPRAQCDKRAYQTRMKWVCERQERLDIKQAQAVRLTKLDDGSFEILTQLDVSYRASVVVVTTGTFLRGLMHVGSNQQQGGRAGDSAAMALSKSLQEFGLELGRLKTGTPPRLLRKSIDFSQLEVQPGDEPVPYFSFWKEEMFHVEQCELSSEAKGRWGGKYPGGSILDRIDGQIACHITHTTPQTAAIVRTNLHRSPMYSGVIEGVGPRYCPSIEDKIVRFSDKERHQIFLEPEGIATDEIYVNGFSTSLPFDVQVDLVRSILGCEHSEIMRPAYAVEYDFAFPSQLHSSLETKCCPRLFLAGQINGTSGYEEAAAQGIMAGINAVRKLQAKPAVVFGRDQAYIGVLIDDLITKSTLEPYRMFTSRAEYRLLLRQDNADRRLSPIGYEIGLLPQRQYDRVLHKADAVRLEINRLQHTHLGSTSLAQILSRPEVTYEMLDGRDTSLTEEVFRQVEIEIKYQGYVQRQAGDVERSRSMESVAIPSDFNYDGIPSLRTEARLKLGKIRPASLGQASRISGVSPADVSLVAVWVKRGAKRIVDAPGDAGSSHFGTSQP